MYTLYTDDLVLLAGQNYEVQCEYNVDSYQLHKPVGRDADTVCFFTNRGKQWDILQK
jgi:hypothetical protein